METNTLYIKWKDSVLLPEKILMGTNTLKYFISEASYKTGTFDPNYFMEILTQHIQFTFYATPSKISLVLSEPVKNLVMTYDNTKDYTLSKTIYDNEDNKDNGDVCVHIS